MTTPDESMPAEQGRLCALGAAMLRISASLDLETVLHEAVDSARADRRARALGGGHARGPGADRPGSPTSPPTTLSSLAHSRRLHDRRCARRSLRPRYRFPQGMSCDMGIISRIQ